MSRYPLSSKIAEFATTALDMVGSKGWQGRLSALWDRHQAEFADKSASSRKLYVSKFRKGVRDTFAALPDDDERRDQAEAVVGYVDFPEGLNETLNAQYQKTIKTRTRSLTVVKDFRAVVRVFESLLEEDSVRLKALAVMFLTGRRFLEVMSDAEFSEVVEDRPGASIRQKYVLEFSGQAKTRRAEGTKYGQSYRIPCLTSAESVVTALEIVRESREGVRWGAMTPYELNASESGRMNQLLRGVLAGRGLEEPDILDGLTIKQLRALYAEIAFEVFAPKTITKSAYFGQILGHSEDDNYTSLSYMVYVLGDDADSMAAARQDVQDALDCEDDGKVVE